MDKKLFLRFVPALAVLATTSGCVDDAYDLSDIDTDMEIKVTDLTIPIKLDEIDLSTVFDIDDESSIKTIDGQYAFVVEGGFDSDPVTIAPVSFQPSQIAPLHVNLVKYDGSDLNIPVSSSTLAYQINPVNAVFEYESDNVDKSIRDLRDIKINCPVKMFLTVDDRNNLFKSLQFKNLQFEVPSAMITTAYPQTSGVITVGDVTADLGGETIVEIPVSEIDFNKFTSSDYTFTARNNAPGCIRFKGDIGIKGGSVVATTSATSTSVPQNVDLNLKIVMGEVQVLSFTGTMGYAIDGFDIPVVEIEDIPDFLTDGQTDISLYNPQLYLSANNPLAADKLKIESGLTLTSLRHGNIANVCPLDATSIISIGYDKGVNGQYPICLSPYEVSDFYQGYSGAEWVKYSTLGTLLAGSGIPTEVEVKFNNPCVPESPVDNFVVGRTLGAVTGNYTLVSPLSFNAGSRIVYSEEETGWSDDTLEKLTISNLGVTATITNSLPLEITVSGTPLDKYGKPCVDPKTGQQVKLQGFTVPANTTANVTLSSVGTITNLDGIRYEAAAEVAETGVPLRPDALINVKDIKVTVSGSYRDTF